jgi:hypothetical protein
LCAFEHTEGGAYFQEKRPFTHFEEKRPFGPLACGVLSPEVKELGGVLRWALRSAEEDDDDDGPPEGGQRTWWQSPQTRSVGLAAAAALDDAMSLGAGLVVAGLATGPASELAWEASVRLDATPPLSLPWALPLSPRALPAPPAGSPAAPTAGSPAAPPAAAPPGPPLGPVPTARRALLPATVKAGGKLV